MTLLKEYQLQEKQLLGTLETTKKFIANFEKERDERQVDVRLSLLDDALSKFYLVRRKADILKEQYGVAGTEKDDAGELIDPNKAVWEFENLYCELKSVLLEKRPKKEDPFGGFSQVPTTQTSSARVA